MQARARPFALLLFAAGLTADPASATLYGSSGPPTCAVLRNDVPGRPFVAPNEADTQRAAQAYKISNFAVAAVFATKVDQMGTAELQRLPPSFPQIDRLIDRSIFNLILARSILGKMLQEGNLGFVNLTDAAQTYQRAIDAHFTDDRGCVHYELPSFEIRQRLAGMYLYGVGVPIDRARARALLANDASLYKDDAKAIVAAIDRNRLPPDYESYLRVAKTEMTEGGKNLKQRQDAQFYEAFKAYWGFGDSGWSPWIKYLVMAVVVSLFGIAGLAVFLELRRNAGGVGTIGRFSFDAMRAAFGRLDLFFKGAMALGIGCSLLVSTFETGTFFWSALPWYMQWLEYALIFTMIAMVGHGLFSIVASLRSDRKPDQAQVHGSARPAPEAEAHAAADGASKKSDLHDRTFEG